MSVWRIRLVLAVLFFGVVVVGAQMNHEQGAFHPTLKQCETLAKPASDIRELRRRPASEIDELDRKLSVCIGDYGPLTPAGVPLILSAHGNVADEMRIRLENAIKTLPVEEQAKVWAAFTADQGSIDK
jgi:hypothetical protein